MPRLVRYYEQNHAHFITASTYHRARLFDAGLLRNLFVHALGQVRDALEFPLIGYVLMPGHRRVSLFRNCAAFLHSKHKAADLKDGGPR